MPGSNLSGTPDVLAFQRSVRRSIQIVRATSVAQGAFTMPKGQEKSKTTNKPKLTVKEKKAKKKEKAGSK